MNDIPREPVRGGPTVWGRPYDKLVRFPDEAAAQRYVVQLLRPFCYSLVEQPAFGTLRPDIGFRLTALPHIQLLVECKSFAEHPRASLTKALRQAADYSAATGNVTFVSLLQAPGVTSLYDHSYIGGALMMAGQYNVGALAVSGTRLFLALSEQAVVYLELSSNGLAQTHLHPHAERLLTYKHRNGSDTWRE